MTHTVLAVYWLQNFQSSQRKGWTRLCTKNCIRWKLQTADSKSTSTHVRKVLCCWSPPFRATQIVTFTLLLNVNRPMSVLNCAEAWHSRVLRADGVYVTRTLFIKEWLCHVLLLGIAFLRGRVRERQSKTMEFSSYIILITAFKGRNVAIALMKYC